MFGGMAMLEEYIDYGLNQLNLDLGGADGIGNIELMGSADVLDHCVQHRMQVIDMAIANAYKEHGDEVALSMQQKRQLLRYGAYIAAVQSIRALSD